MMDWNFQSEMKEIMEGNEWDIDEISEIARKEQMVDKIMEKKEEKW
jgi:hypothetical protein